MNIGNIKLLKGLQLFPATSLIYEEFMVKISLNSKMSSMSYDMFNICNTEIAKSEKVGIYSSFCLSKRGDFSAMGQDIGLKPSVNERGLKNKHPGGCGNAFGTNIII